MRTALLSTQDLKPCRPGSPFGEVAHFLLSQLFQSTFSAPSSCLGDRDIVCTQPILGLPAAHLTSIGASSHSLRVILVTAPLTFVNHWGSGQGPMGLIWQNSYPSKRLLQPPPPSLRLARLLPASLNASRHQPGSGLCSLWTGHGYWAKQVNSCLKISKYGFGSLRPQPLRPLVRYEISRVILSC